MATFRLWLLAILIVTREVTMGLFGKSSKPAVTPAVDPGATPDPSTTVASATPVPDPVTPVTAATAPVASTASFPTSAPTNPNPGDVYPVQATPPSGDVRAPQTPSEWWAMSKDSAKQARKRLSWQEVVSYLLQLGILWAVGFIDGPVLVLTQGQLAVIVVTTVICTVALWSLFWKFWVPDERAAQHFGADRGLDAILQLAVALVAIYQLIRILM